MSRKVFEVIGNNWTHFVFEYCMMIVSVDTCITSDHFETHTVNEQ